MAAMTRSPIPAKATDGAPAGRAAPRPRVAPRDAGALIDVSLVLAAQQRQAIAGPLTGSPLALPVFAHPHAASAATT
jgi:hypothetical protein